MASLQRLAAHLRPGRRRADALDIVQGVAQELIGRPLDEAQALTLADRIAGDPTQARNIVHELLRANEARQHAAPILLIDAPALAARTTWISLGTHCFTASLLQRWGLRHGSGPFDWLFVSPTMVSHALGDDFATLLDRTQYRPVPVELRVNGPDVNRVDHAFYRDQYGVSFVFNHHDVHLDEGHAYLTRCVERLREDLGSASHKTFLLFRRFEETRLAEIDDLHRAIAQRTTNFRLCVFAVDTVGPLLPLPLAEPLREESTLAVWRYRPASVWQTLHFESPLDELAVLRLSSAHETVGAGPAGMIRAALAIPPKVDSEQRPIAASPTGSTKEQAIRVFEHPPAINMQRIGAKTWSTFLAAGQRISASILRQIELAIPGGLPSSVRILDFGCGCGRVLYPMVEALPNAAFSAVDVDGSAIAYLRRNLPEVDLRITSFSPPLPFADGSFDLIYSVSIWTHLSPEDQVRWLVEIARVLRPGGHALITTSSHSALEQRRLRGDPGWNAVSGADLDAKGVIFIPYQGPDRQIWTPGIEQPYGLTLNSPENTRQMFSPVFDVRQVIVDEIDGVQDLVVLAKR